MTTHEPGIRSLSLSATVSADGEQSFLQGLLGNHTFSCALTVRGGVQLPVGAQPIDRSVALSLHRQPTPETTRKHVGSDLGAGVWCLTGQPANEETRRGWAGRPHGRPRGAAAPVESITNELWTVPGSGPATLLALARGRSPGRRHRLPARRSTGVWCRPCGQGRPMSPRRL
jgi:hypothetical protein